MFIEHLLWAWHRGTQMWIHADVVLEALLHMKSEPGPEI